MDGAGAVVLGPVESDDPREGIVYTKAGADGTGAESLYLEGIFTWGAAIFRV